VVAKERGLALGPTRAESEDETTGADPVDVGGETRQPVWAPNRRAADRNQTDTPGHGGVGRERRPTVRRQERVIPEPTRVKPELVRGLSVIALLKPVTGSCAKRDPKP
jgi:hypothetical protein